MKILCRHGAEKVEMAKMLVIGLDGATFDVINPLIEEGFLPNLEKLIEQGASASLRSTMPPVTGPAWFALATGMTPGKSGFFDFIVRANSDNWSFRFLNSSDFENRAVWDVLGRSGKRVCLFNYPCLYPPYPVNGSMISGGVGSSNLSGFTHPADLEDKITHFVGYNRQVNLKDSKYKDLNVFLADLYGNFEANVQSVEYVLKQESWDFTWAVFSQTDWLQHMMWKHFENGQTVTDDGRLGGYGRKFKDFWACVDKAIGRLRSCVGDDTNIVIVSDHGFGSVGESFRLNAWLRQEGYLKLARGGWKGFTAVKKIRKLLRNLAGMLAINRLFPRFFTWAKNKTVSIMIPLHFIDYEETVAFDPGHIGSMGGIYINERALKDGQAYEVVRNEIIEKLEQVGRENNWIVEALRPEDIYGQKTPGSPDIILRINDGSCVILKEFDGRIVEYNKLPDRISFLSGTHRMAGVIIAAGPDFIQTKVDGAKLWDIAPTILHSFDEPVPSYMEGVVLREALRRKEKTKYEKEEIEASRKSGKKTLSRDEEEQIRKQLSDLGYF